MRVSKVLTLWSLQVDNCVVIFEHVDFINVLQLLHAYENYQMEKQRYLPNFLMVDLSFLSSFTSWPWLWTTFLVLLWVPIKSK